MALRRHLPSGRETKLHNCPSRRPTRGAMHLSRRLAVVAVAALVTAFAAGCSGSESAAGSASSEQMSLEKSCLKTQCDVLKRDGREQCSTCTSACSQASYGCNASCSERKCSASQETECATTGYKASLPATANAEVEAACNRVRVRLAGCGVEPFEASACTLFAKTERGEMAATYDCYAAQPCDATAEAAAAACEPKPSTFGDELCAAVGDCDSLCSEERQQLFNREGAWLRSDVMQSARDCRAAATCSDVKSCLGAWAKAVLP